MSAEWPAADLASFAFALSRGNPAAARTWLCRHRIAARTWATLAAVGMTVVFGQSAARRAPVGRLCPGLLPSATGGTSSDATIAAAGGRGGGRAPGGAGKE